MSTTDTPPAAPGDRIDGWKEISTHLGRSVRTAQRWESQLDLPIRRIHGVNGETVYAYRSELEAWRARQAPETLQGRTARAWFARPVPAASLLGAVVLLVMAAWSHSRSTSATLTIDGAAESRRPQGEIFVFRGEGYAPHASIHRAVRYVEGSTHAVTPSVLSDADGRIRATFATDCATPVGPFDYWMADSALAPVSATVRGHVLANTACAEPLPDLSAEDVELSTTTAAPGEVVDLSFVVTNTGQAIARPFATLVRLGGPDRRGRVGDQVLANVEVGSVAPGARLQQRVTLSLPASLAPGRYYVWVVLDYNNSLLQRLTTNDVVASPLLTVR